VRPVGLTVSKMTKMYQMFKETGVTLICVSPPKWRPEICVSPMGDTQNTDARASTNKVAAWLRGSGERGKEQGKA